MNKLFPIIRYCILALAVLAVIMTGCSSTAQRSVKQAANEPSPSEPATAKQEQPVEIDLEKVKPNELGQVLILEYHEVSDTEGRWSRHYNNFRADLQRLYQAGYRPISIRDFVRNNINIPAGTSPVIFTFDDGTAGQFHYINGPNGPEVDPNCAVGIMQDFHSKHPDWALEATFYIYYPNPFRQPEYIERKLKQIVALGMDIGNHTYSHVNLRKLSTSGAAREMALSVREAQRYAPDAVVDSIALPYGIGPTEESVLRSGEYEGHRYENIAALLVGAEPAPSPVDKKFDPYRLPRVQAIQSELDKWLGYFEKYPEKRYVSDGDHLTVTAPEELMSEVDQNRIGDKRIRTY